MTEQDRGNLLFAMIVNAYLRLDNNNQRDLADEFEAAISTVARWAKGTYRPHPRMQELIVAWISKRVE